MRNIGEEYKMTARLPWETNGLLNDEETRTAKDKALWQLMANGRKKRPTRAAVLAAILLNFESRPDAERAAIILDGMGRLNAIIEDRGSERPDMNIPVKVKPSRPGKTKGSG